MSNREKDEVKVMFALIGVGFLLMIFGRFII